MSAGTDWKQLAPGQNSCSGPLRAQLSNSPIATHSIGKACEKSCGQWEIQQHVPAIGAAVSARIEFSSDPLHLAAALAAGAAVGVEYEGRTFTRLGDSGSVACYACCATVPLLPLLTAGVAESEAAAWASIDADHQVKYTEQAPSIVCFVNCGSYL